MLVFIATSILFSVIYYVQAFKTGLTAKKWAFAGLFFWASYLSFISFTTTDQIAAGEGIK